jgi:hypothetical protein
MKLGDITHGSYTYKVNTIAVNRTWAVKSVNYVLLLTHNAQQ